MNSGGPTDYFTLSKIRKAGENWVKRKLVSGSISVAKVTLITLALSVSADEVQKLELDIPSQTMSESLREVANKFGLKIAFFSSDVAGVHAPSLVGTFSAFKAFETLVQDEALEFEYVDASSVVVRRTGGVSDRSRHSAKKEETMHKPRNGKFLNRFISAIVGTLAGSGVVASEATQGGETGIEEIVVTAERRTSTVQTTSIAITALTSDILSERILREPEDIEQYIPGTTIQTLDVSIRGIGRTLRTLGGDPGVATYVNGFYSEDFTQRGSAGGLFDVERIEVLRGPQGTLYGRNAIGGAINIISKRPSFEREGEVRAIVQNYDTAEVYGVISGPLIEEKLAGRISVASRQRNEGIYNETSPAGDEDLGDQDDRDVSVSLRFEPNETFSVYLRATDRDFDSNYVANSASSPVILSENGITEGYRDTSTYAFGYRPITVGDTDFNSPTYDSPQSNFSFTNPSTGTVVVAERIRPGVDGNAAVTDAPFFLRGVAAAGGLLPNYAYGELSPLPLTSGNNLEGGDLDVTTNGIAYTRLHQQQSVNLELGFNKNNYDLTYRFGYWENETDVNSDGDKSGGTRFGTQQTFALSDNKNVQHEIQLIFDASDSLSITSGAFYYESKIRQRADVHDPIDVECRFRCDGNYGFLDAATVGAILGEPNPIGIRTAEDRVNSGQIELDAQGRASVLAPWYGDTGTALKDGIPTPGTYFSWDNYLRTRAKALYAQADWTINDDFAATVGVRWSEDEKIGIERTYFAFETAPFLGFTGLTPDLTPFIAPACPNGNVLCAFNVLSGALDAATLEPTGNAPVHFNSPQFALSNYFPLRETFDETTWRINLDWTPREQELIYISATTGYRSGGFNLGLSSPQLPVFDPETVIAYELGYKSSLWLNGRLQVNGAAFWYDYEDMQVTALLDSAGSTFTSVINAPTATIKGLEIDSMWLATDTLTVGGYISYTDTGYDESFNFSSNKTPETPPSLFSPTDLLVDVDGNRLNFVPLWKANIWLAKVWTVGPGELEFFLSGTYTDDVYFTVDNSDLDKAPSFTRWDARLKWTRDDGRLSITGFVNNILDEIGIRDFGPAAESSNFLRNVATTNPRLFGIEVSYHLFD